ncbi:MAG: exodeoxyribonuclease VII small subunit [Cyanobacteria bacterium J06638_7]
MARQSSQGPGRRQPSAAAAATLNESAAEVLSDGDGGAADLSYSQARTALELVLAELQTNDLDVEAMAGLYRRGQAYARRCEEILDQVEQEILLWDGLNDPADSPQPSPDLSADEPIRPLP